MQNNHISLKYPEKGNGVISVGQVMSIDASCDLSEEVIWEVSDEKVIKLIDNGKVMGITEGSAIIRAYYKEHPEVSDTLGITVYDSKNDILDTLVRANCGNILHQKVISFGSDSYEVGEKNFLNDVFGSVSKYYFGSLNLNDSFIDVTERGGRPGLLKHSTDWIVIHDTGNTSKTANAKGHANYLKGQPGLSWHYTVDDHEIWHHVPDNEVGWHAGDGSRATGTWINEHGEHLGGGNQNGIGIETCVNEGSDLYATWQTAAKLVSHLLKDNGLSIDKVRQHHDFSNYNKDCPRTLRNAGLWGQFMELVKTEYDVLMQADGCQITCAAEDPMIVSGAGRVLGVGASGKTVAYTVTVVKNGVKSQVTLYGKIN